MNAKPKGSDEKSLLMETETFQAVLNSVMDIEILPLSTNMPLKPYEKEAGSSGLLIYPKITPFLIFSVSLRKKNIVSSKSWRFTCISSDVGIFFTDLSLQP